MQEHAGALDMAEEPVADADALMGALDQAGDIGQHEFAAVDGGDAEIGMQRGEGIIGDLRPGAVTRPGRSTCRHWAGRPGRRRRSA
jgi:hypothetical protein